MKTNCTVRHASHQNDAKHYDTATLREQYLVENLMVADEVNMTYSMFDRIVAGGAVPVAESIELQAPSIFRCDFFTSRREVGFINVGGAGSIEVDGKSYELAFKEALYVGRGDKKIVLKSKDAKNPAKFYFNSAPAHCAYPDKHITKANAVVMNVGSPAEGNHRIINRMIVQEVTQTCQLQMGMTELQTGSVWNTMPAHTHERRMEVYFYFELPEGQAVCHFMGEPQETRHIWMHAEQAVISPQWSIHSACATSNYTFIWGMAGENLDYTDMDGCPTTELK